MTIAYRSGQHQAAPPATTTEDERRRRRQGLGALVFCCYCIGFLVIVGLVIGLIVTATRTTTSTPSPPPSDPVGACCVNDECSRLRNSSCVGLFYGADSVCTNETCAVAPAQCRCRNFMSGRLIVAAVRPSSTEGACIDIDVTFNCVDSRADTRCGARTIPYAFAVLDEDRTNLVDTHVTANVFDDTRTECSDFTTIVNYQCVVTTIPPSAAATGTTLTLFNRDVVEENQVLTIATTKNETDTPTPYPCEPTFSLRVETPLDLTPYSCREPPFGACCLRGPNACFEHSTRDACTVLGFSISASFDSFTYTPGARCEDVCADTDLNPRCAAFVPLTDPVHSTCTNRGSQDTLSDLENEFGNQLDFYAASQCNVETGCCGPTASAK